jgi:ATPase subunit of ABC transporter with duplicated ATPase domains
MKHELEWVRSNPKGRHAKSKARLARFEELQLAGIPEAQRDQRDLHPAGPRLGDLVIEAEGLRKAYGDKLLYEDLSFNLPKGGIVGIIGPNGAGKTTLFRIMTGQEQPDGGELRVGETVESAMWIRAATRWTARRRSGRRSPTAPTTSSSAATRCPRAPMSAASTSAAPTSRSASATCPAASATACTWPSC